MDLIVSSPVASRIQVISTEEMSVRICPQCGAHAIRRECMAMTLAGDKKWGDEFWCQCGHVQRGLSEHTVAEVLEWAWRIEQQRSHIVE